MSHEGETIYDRGPSNCDSDPTSTAVALNHSFADANNDSVAVAFNHSAAVAFNACTATAVSGQEEECHR